MNIKRMHSYMQQTLFLFMWLVCSGSLLAQVRSVSGIVKDAAGSALPGVGIRVKGTYDDNVWVQMADGPSQDKNQNGISRNQAHTYSRINYRMLDVDDPYPLMNYAETQFLMAEALERRIGSGITGTSRSHYEEGVKAACQMWTPYDLSLTVSDSAVEAYLANYPYGVTKSAPEMIGDQMWISKWMNWWEAWSDWRRTGYPVLTPVDYPGNDSNSQIPTKLIIPEDEEATNPNFTTGATQPNDFTGEVWWDGGPE